MAKFGESIRFTPPASATVLSPDHSSLDELTEALASFAAGNPHPAVHSSVTPGAKRPLGFIFTGLGPQWWGMGRQLLRDSPVYRAVIERCDAALTPLAG